MTEWQQTIPVEDRLSIGRLPGLGMSGMVWVQLSASHVVPMASGAKYVQFACTVHAVALPGLKVQLVLAKAPAKGTQDSITGSAAMAALHAAVRLAKAVVLVSMPAVTLGTHERGTKPSPRMAEPMVG